MSDPCKKFIKAKYLKRTRKPSFQHFVKKFENEIATLSTNLGCKNALALQNNWINIYNDAIPNVRPEAPLRKRFLEDSGTDNVFVDTSNHSVTGVAMLRKNSSGYMKPVCSL